MDSNLFSLPTGVKHQQQQNIDTVFWSNKNIPKNKLLVVAFTFGILFVVGVTVYFTYQIYVTKLSAQTSSGKLGIVIFYLLCCLLVVGSFAMIYSLTWTEAIKISNDYIIIKHFGAFAPKMTQLTKHQVLALSFQRFHGGDQEILPSLNLLYKDNLLTSHVEKREQIAFWMRKKEKYQLFLILQTILKERDWKIKYWVEP